MAKLKHTRYQYTPEFRHMQARVHNPADMHDVHAHDTATGEGMPEWEPVKFDGPEGYD